MRRRAAGSDLPRVVSRLASLPERARSLPGPRLSGLESRCPLKGSAASLVERGRALFNAGSFFEAHELWEDAWREARGEAKILLQGLIQIAAGFYKAGQAKPGGCARLLEAGLEKLEQADAAGRLSSFALQVRVALARARAWEGGDDEGLGPVPVLPPLGSIESD